MPMLDIPRDHPACDGHFPGRPLVPGAVLLDEALALCERERMLDLSQWDLESAKFLSAVQPGVGLVLEILEDADRLELVLRDGARIALRARLRRHAGPS
jgi:3-hydroxyacyl-[acyl-carrier-protein] dehydratase